MSDEPQVVEPVVDRWTEGKNRIQLDRLDSAHDLSIFRLSGGVLKTSVKNSDDIDNLLTRIMASPSSGRYQRNIDRNLDYLFTSLQLDLINSIAERCVGTIRPESVRTPSDEEEI